MDPRGRALNPLQSLRGAAERLGYILISSYNTVSDGAIEPNEVAVAAFLDRLIPFSKIADTNSHVLQAHLADRRGAVVSDLAAVREADAWARACARRHLGLEAAPVAMEAC